MVVAIDIGGTKTLIVSFDEAGQQQYETRFATPHNPADFFDRLNVELNAIDLQQVTAVAVAAPGIVDSASGTIHYLPNLRWKDVPIKKQLTRRFHCPIYVGNDANFAGLGAVQALDSIPALALYVTIGTGIGTSILVHGELHPALTNIEAGHMLFETSEGTREWESFASGRAIFSTYKQLAADITNETAWKQIAQNLCVGLQALIPALQPDLIIVGGGVGVQFDRFAPLVQKQLLATIPSFLTVPPIISAIDPDKAVIHGCYYYALTHTNHQ